MPNRQYRQEDWLREQYVDNRRASTDIANECSVSAQTILTWLEKHGIERRDASQSQIREVKKFHDKDWLRQKYIEERCSMKDIADECGVSASGVKKWIDNFGICARKPTDHYRFGPASFYTSQEKGYEYVSARYQYNTDSAMVHQLVAIAHGANPSKVFSDGRYHIHHKNGVKWDNRPSNLELKSAKTHAVEHHHDEKHNIPADYATESCKEELLFELRRVINDWRGMKNSTTEMCADELDGLLREL